MKLIPLTQGKFAQVDDADFEWLNQFKWYAWKGDNTFYAGKRIYIDGKRTAISMHRFILGLTKRNEYGDHIDFNGLNNQRSNLRVASPSQSICNRRAAYHGNSKYLGVFFINKKWRDKTYPYWVASIKKNGKKLCIGYFKTENEAAEAYNKKATELHGSFANLNIISWSANGMAQ